MKNKYESVTILDKCTSPHELFDSTIRKQTHKNIQFYRSRRNAMEVILHFKERKEKRYPSSYIFSINYRAVGRYVPYFT
jgi:CHASE1-domain containing sensor protein